MRQFFLKAVITIFVLLGIGFAILGKFQPQFQTMVLHIGNLMMALLSLAAFMLVNKQTSDKPYAFVRGVSSASFLKLMVCMVAFLAYALLNRHHIHKPTVFVLFGVYTVYSAVETILLSKNTKLSKTEGTEGRE